MGISVGQCWDKIEIRFARCATPNNFWTFETQRNVKTNYLIYVLTLNGNPINTYNSAHHRVYSEKFHA